MLETFTYQEFYQTVTGENTIHEWLLSSHTNARGGVTLYEYLTYQDDNYLYKYPLLKKRIEPQTAAGSKVTEYKYDNARRVIQEGTTDSEGGVTITDYQYNPQTGWLEMQKVTGNQVHAVTQYKYNDFGQVIRQTSPDGVVTGKSYGMGGIAQ